MSDKPLTKSEDLKYQLESLASYEPNDIDNPAFEVAYENGSGQEGFLTICCVDIANRALERIKELEEKLHFLVDNDSINDSSIDKEVSQLLSK